TDSRVWSVLPSLKNVAETTAGPVDSRSGWVMTTTFWALMSPTVVAALSGLTWRVSALLPDAHAESEATENAMAEAARAPRRRLLLRVAATPWTRAWRPVEPPYVSVSGLRLPSRPRPTAPDPPLSGPVPPRSRPPGPPGPACPRGGFRPPAISPTGAP